MSDNQTPAPKSANDVNNTIVLIWVLTIFFGFIPSLIFYLTQKDDARVQDQAKEALNWSITATIGYFAGAITSFILIGLLILPVIGLAHLIFCILGAVNGPKTENFRVPFALRLIK
ncbi:hypothetical protein SAMN02745857_03424 [Andreprevotia lacus DSM 23236]|jgi:uncharacterized Tic20 family protein|uniref:DUF4870 domain-containing protein n=1 Tax=Andreprevotia lacus DSM 23236 TaxID=1121001 RepID=A0A1W1XY52_9NEIS|nr:DUF4870 domain-containing protein [Andreprevotia lacus]SMC28805.1 hypothetical protein SAMN02745857_03424 [Andreprevotia lacus DSM 23236]